MGRDSALIDPFAGFRPTPTQDLFLNWQPPDPRVPSLRLLSSGYASGGKTTVGCRESIRQTLTHPHSRNAISRFHYDDLTDTTMVSYFEALDRIGLNDGRRPGARHYIFRKSPRPEIDWWHGAKTLFRNLDDPSGSKYGSMEVNTWFIDEGYEVDEEVLQVIFPSRLRWHLPGCEWKNELDAMIASGKDTSMLGCLCPKMMFACTNPGPNDFFKGVVDGKLANAQHFAVPFGENIYMAPGYFEALDEQGKAYGEVWHARFVHGSWDAFEGQRFTMLDRATHFLPQDFMPSADEYEIIEDHDFGYRNPHAITWIAVHKGREYPPIVVDDYSVAGREIPHHAKAIRERRRLYGWPDREVLAVGDPAGLQTRGAGVSDIMLFATHGIEIVPMTRAKLPDGRADLIALMLSRHVHTREGPMRGLMFCPRAHRTFDACLNYRFVEPTRKSRADEPEKFLKKDDHLVDALGYGVSAISDPLEQEGPSGPRSEWQEALASRRMPTLDELDAAANVPSG